MSFNRDKSVLFLATEYEFQQMKYFAKRLNVSRSQMIRMAVSLLQTNTKPSDHCVFRKLYEDEEGDEK